MPENINYNNIGRYNNPENGLELSIKDYNLNRIIDPAKISRFKVLDIKEYILKMPYSNKKAVSFFTHIDSPEYTVVWVSDNKLEQVVHKFVKMYNLIRDTYPEQSSSFFDKVTFAFEDGDPVDMEAISLYGKKSIDGMLENRNKKEISFDNEFFNVYIKKIKLENEVKGTKIVFDSNYDFSIHLPAMINQTRADINRDSLKIRFENKQITMMLRDFLKYYFQLDKISMASDENVPDTPENMYGFSMN